MGIFPLEIPIQSAQYMILRQSKAQRIGAGHKLSVSQDKNTSVDNVAETLAVESAAAKGNTFEFESRPY